VKPLTVDAEPVSREEDSKKLSEDVRANRQAILNQIHVRIPESLVTENMTVALVEDRHSIYLHPDFMDADRSTTLFTEPNPQTGLLEQIRIQDWSTYQKEFFGDKNLASKPVLLLPIEFEKRSFDESKEHGTHVAGILAGWGTNGVSGVAPGARVVAVSTQMSGKVPRDLKSITDDLQDAFKAGVLVASISQAIPESTTVDSVKADISNPQKQLGQMLFVVSAGNHGLNVSEDGHIAFRTWVHELQDNIIGVGALNGDHQFIKTCKSNHQEIIGCSNFGTKDVELLAPGQWVYSTGMNSGYVEATGTSMAAPQVAAAAALIRAFNTQFGPRDTKTRLIYTANFRHEYIDQDVVWGGELNIERALLGLNGIRPILTFRGAESRRFLVAPLPLHALNSTIRLKERGEIVSDGVSPKSELGPAPKELLWSDILRIQRDLPNDPYKKDTFWVVYRDSKASNKIRIARNIKFEDSTIPCKQFKELKLPTLNVQTLVENEAESESIPTDLSTFCVSSDSGLGVSIQQLSDYVAPPFGRSLFRLP
jgi:hypothetical protein